MKVDPTIVAIQMAWGGGSGAGPSVLSKEGAKALLAYADSTKEQLNDKKTGWESVDGDRLRLALPTAGNLTGTRAAARGSALVEVEDLAVGIDYLESSKLSRLCAP